MHYDKTIDFARAADENDPLARFRSLFHIPIIDGRPCLYFCGNSLGLQPVTAKDAVLTELEAWQYLGVEGHFSGKNPWMHYHQLLTAGTARLVGAKPSEVVVMNNLTVNLHLMLVTFYRPTQKRFKIIMEGGAFPSDQYALESQVRLHGFDPEQAIIELHPRPGELTMRTEDILQTIRQAGDELALVMLGGVNYYTGQFYNMTEITRAAHQAGAIAGFDLAHAAGNLALRLHDWDVDFAVWCTYKYLNSGPGGTSGVFIHERYAQNTQLPRFAGWWGYVEKDRFKMQKGFRPTPTAEGWQLSNAQILPMAVHKASLDIFDEAGIENLREKSLRLTGYLEFLIHEFNREQQAMHIEIITPQNPDERGCQLSLIVEGKGRQLHQNLLKAGVVADWREPNVIRMAPVPLYNRFMDVYEFYELLKVTALQC